MEADDGGSELDACEALDGDVKDRLSLDWLDLLDPLGDPDFDGELRLESGELGVEPDDFEGELALLGLSLEREPLDELDRPLGDDDLVVDDSCDGELADDLELAELEKLESDESELDLLDEPLERLELLELLDRLDEDDELREDDREDEEDGHGQRLQLMTNWPSSEVKRPPCMDHKVSVIAGRHRLPGSGPDSPARSWLTSRRRIEP